MIMNNVSGALWAQLVALNPEKENIKFIIKPNESTSYQANNEWKIYHDIADESTWIMSLSALHIRIDGTWLKKNFKRRLSGGELIAFSMDKNLNDNVYDYAFCLVRLEPTNPLKRELNENQSSQMIASSQVTQKLIKLEDDFQKELICSLCISVFHRCATLNPCQHSFCSFCLWTLLKKSNKCPLCQVEAVSVTKNLVLQNLVKSFLSSFPHLEKHIDNVLEKQMDLTGIIVRNEDEIYVGSYVNGKREDKGIFGYKDNEVFQGSWKDDKREGQGIFIWKNGAMYDGGWKEDYREGFGKYIYADGDVYEGNWRKGDQVGNGVMRYANGMFYRGEWKKNKKEGKGVQLYKNGDRYEGSWITNLFNKMGKYTWSDGREYEGYWTHGVKILNGTMKYLDGSIYSGPWKDNNRQGNGILTLMNADKLEGKWDNDVLGSHVKIKYSNGDTYEGEIETETFKKHGKGVLILANGEKHDGQWTNDQVIGDKKDEGGKIEQPIKTCVNGVQDIATSQKIKQIKKTKQRKGKENQI